MGGGFRSVLRRAETVSLKVVLADTRSLVCEAVAEALAAEPHFQVVVKANDLPSALLQAKRIAADVLVIGAPLRRGTEEASKQLSRLEPPVRTLVLDHTSEEQALLHAVEAGADGYIGGEVGLPGLVEAIHACSRGESVVPPALLGPLLRGLIQRQRDVSRIEDQVLALTRRERQVLAMMVAGGTSATVAEQLVISPETIRTHVQRILRKLSVHSQADAIALIVRSGLADRLQRMVEGTLP